MTKQEKLDLLVKIITFTNNFSIAALLIFPLFLGKIGVASSIFIYLFIGSFLAIQFHNVQVFWQTICFWLPALWSIRVTGWITKN